MLPDHGIPGVFHEPPHAPRRADCRRTGPVCPPDLVLLAEIAHGRPDTGDIRKRREIRLLHCRPYLPRLVKRGGQRDAVLGNLIAVQLDHPVGHEAEVRKRAAVAVGVYPVGTQEREFLPHRIPVGVNFPVVGRHVVHKARVNLIEVDIPRRAGRVERVRMGVAGEAEIQLQRRLGRASRWRAVGGAVQQKPSPECRCTFPPPYEGISPLHGDSVCQPQKPPRRAPRVCRGDQHGASVA